MNKALIAKGATLIISAAVFLSALPFSAFAESVSMTNAVRSLESDIAVPDNQISTDNYKDTRFNNPISPDFFCADPTAVEYNGRLYVYGTNDHQQFEAAGPDVDNTYEKIKSLLVFSTEDMVN